MEHAHPQVCGHWYGGDSSARCDAVLTVDLQGWAQVRGASSDQTLAAVELSQLKVSSRLGNSARYLSFPGGGMLETTDNDSVDALLQHWSPSRWRGLLHHLESRWQWVALSVVIVVFSGWAFVQYGIPAAAHHLAQRLPAQTLDKVASEVLTMLDRSHFSPSQLPRERQQELQQRFSQITSLYPDLRLRVLFRRGGDSIGANAFALPDGTMIFTDEIVALAHNDEELLAVLAHEIGHIAERHSLRAVIQSALLGVGYVLLVGDASASADLLLGLPVMVASLSYSRQHEREADAFSAAVLDEQGIDRIAFVNLMRRLGHSHHCRQLIGEAQVVDEEDLSEARRLELCEELQAAREQESTGTPIWGDYLSTHPGMHQRLEDFLERY